MSILTACGNGNPVTLLDFLGEDTDSIDMNGQDILFIGESEVDSGMIVDGILENTLFYDCLMERFDEINKRYNVNIVYDCYGNSDAYEDRFNALMISGVCPGDVIYGHGNSKLQAFV